MNRYVNIEITPTGFKGRTAFRHVKGEKPQHYAFSASFPLFLIREAWERGCNAIEAHADGFGPGMGTQGDWSAIRDSSPAAINRMLEDALNFLFPEGPSI